MKMELVPFKKEHGATIAKWIVDPAYTDYFRCLEAIPTQEDCDNYPRWSGHFMMMIELNGKPIGEVSLYNISYKNRTGHIGVMIERSYWKNGWARRAIVEWIEYLQRNMGFRKLIVEFTNEELLKPLLEFGFVEEGVHKEQVLLNGKYIDEHRLAIMGGAYCSTVKNAAPVAESMDAVSSTKTANAVSMNSGH